MSTQLTTEVDEDSGPTVSSLVATIDLEPSAEPSAQPSSSPNLKYETSYTSTVTPNMGATATGGGTGNRIEADVNTVLRHASSGQVEHVKCTDDTNVEPLSPNASDTITKEAQKECQASTTLPANSVDANPQKPVQSMIPGDSTKIASKCCPKREMINVTDNSSGGSGFDSFVQSGIPTTMFIDVDAKMFVGRSQEFEQLDMALENNGVAGISGMGGVGKTTLTSLYAYEHFHQYMNGIFYVDANNINTLPFNFAQLAGPDVLDLVPSPEQDIKTSMRLVSSWMKDNTNYLIIYDAADTDDILRELGKDGTWYMGPELGGDIIITSRCPCEKFKIVQITAPILLEDLSVTDASDFLWRRVYAGSNSIDSQERNVAQMVVKEFLPGRLPLHLEQTASYIRRHKLSFTDYMAEMSQRRERNPVGATGFGDNRKTVDDAFTDNFDAVMHNSPEAASLLNMAAVCHSRNIPLALFSVGSLSLLQPSEHKLELSALMTALTKAMVAARIDWDKDLYVNACKTGIGPLRKMLTFPWQSQLVKLTPGGNSFSVHAVIQEQLRLRMKRRGELLLECQTAAAVLLNLLQCDHITLANKPALLAHAEACAKHMVIFSPTMDLTEKKSHSELYIRLRIKTAYVFAVLSSFDAAWGIIAELEEALNDSTSVAMKAMLEWLKSKLCVWQHKGIDALQYAQKGLHLLDSGKAVDWSQAQDVLTYAILNKACAQGLIAVSKSDQEDIQTHMAEAKKALEHIIASGTAVVDCQHEYAHLLMLYGSVYAGIAGRRWDDVDHRQKALTKALLWYKASLQEMCPEKYLYDMLQVDICLTEVELEHKGRPEAITELHSFRKALAHKLGSRHRYTGWVMEKTGHVMMGANQAAAALEMYTESLAIQRKEYGTGGGNIQIARLMCDQAKAQLNVGYTEKALHTLEEAKKLMEGASKPHVLAQIREHLFTARQRLGKPTD